MDKNQVIFSIVFISMLLVLLIGFLSFMLLWQRRRSNHFIQEREAARLKFNEQLLKTQLEIQQQTLNMVSMEIHDNVGQTLSLLKVQMNIMDQSEVLNRTLMSEAKESVSKAMNDLRFMAKSLSTERVVHSNILEMVSYEVQKIRHTGIMEVLQSTDGEERLMSAEIKLISFRIIQECLQNIIKHANATELKITFSFMEHHLIIIIKDNGRGFNKELQKLDDEGSGLKNMIARAALIGGEAQINSVINKGTTVHLTVPYV